MLLFPLDVASKAESTYNHSTHLIGFSSRGTSHDRDDSSYIFDDHQSEGDLSFGKHERYV